MLMIQTGACSSHVSEEDYKDVIACLFDYEWQGGWFLNTKEEGSIRIISFSSRLAGLSI